MSTTDHGRFGKPPPADPRADTSLLRLMAIVLIVNSHLESFYPRAWMAGGGLIGNMLFFAVSGFSLAVADMARPRPFGIWYLRRLTRIYPAVVLVTAVDLCLRGHYPTDLRDLVSLFLWPTSYTFVALIVPFYAVYYWVMRLRSRRAYLLGLLALLPAFGGVYIWYLRGGWYASHFGMPVLAWATWVFGFQVMLLGGWLALRRDEENVRPWIDLAAVVAAFAVCVAAKYLDRVLHRATWFSGAEFFGAAALFYFALRMSWSPAVLGLRRTAVWAPVALISSLTFEIYLVHEFYIRAAMADLGLPWNVLGLMVLSVATALPLFWLLSRIERRLGQPRRRQPRPELPAIETAVDAPAGRRKVEPAMTPPDTVLPR
ncbi:MAG: acyltransferase family protein [Phycisphaerales bacterium]|nr:acyltransferase family protein [Phycisphaerales bacterium]